VLDFNKPKGSTDPAYHVVKRMLGQHGYLSQFVNFRNYAHDEVREDDKRSNIILQNVARQIIQKTGVRLWWVHVPRSLPTPAVFVGVDVFHAPRVYDPKLKRKVAPGSCAAIIVQIHRGNDDSSKDQIELFTKTYARDPGTEYGLGMCLEETVLTALQELNISPQSCIVWRDGIGDQSLETHAKDEIAGIRNGLRRMNVAGTSLQEKDVPLAYIVCQKRIDTKLFTNEVDSPSDGKCYGAPAGTLVRSIQGLQHDTFYINGTAPAYSTPKPVRYIVVEKDEGIEPVPLHELTWELCHDYANWVRMISSIISQ
jgi:Piwi domain